MKSDSGRWTEVAPSRHVHEREGLEHVRAELPDAAPYHAWSNFEFVALDGTPHEVDLLVLGPAGFHLVELKAWSGKIELDRSGGENDWLEHNPGRGRPLRRRSPLGLTRLKAQSFRSWLEAKARGTGTAVPFVHESLLLHGSHVDCRLPDHLKKRVFGREDDSSNRLGRVVLDRLAMPSQRGAGTPQSEARALVALLERSGLRRPVRRQRAGQWLLDDQPVDSGWGWLDNLARHERFDDEVARVRRWFAPPGTSAQDEVAVRRAAEREYRMLRGLDHPGLVTPRDYHEVEGAVAALVYDHDPDAVGLPSWLEGAGSCAPLDRRLEVVRGLAEVVRYAHDHGLVHRGLSPDSVLVSGDQVRVKDWQTAGSVEVGSGSGTTHALALISHAGDEAMAYAAPETTGGPSADRRAGDVFSVGAIAYLVFTGQAPATDATGLRERLGRDDGLDVSAVLDGAPASLVDLVLEATRPVATQRSGSVDEVLQWLDEVLDELTAPDAEPRVVVDPLDAQPGDELEGGLVVTRALGEGSTSKVFLVSRPDGGEVVLKAARDDGRGSRLVEEAETLRSLPADAEVVHLVEGPVQVGGRTCLLVELAGERTLAHHLGKGRLTLDQLRRWGRDLVEMLGLLERSGLFHRDLKPANLGVRTRSADGQPHLVLFDFSLSGVAASDLAAGTAGYRDPFLGSSSRRVYDAAAEAFSASATLHEMATGALPVWGDGRTAPDLLDEEVRLVRTAFEQTVADGMVGFFTRALARDADARFDNPTEMLRAWEAVFVQAEQAGSQRRPDEDAAAATLSTPLARSGLSPRALSALEQYAVATVEDLLRVPALDLSRTPGAAQSTKDEIRTRSAQWRRSLVSDDAPAAESVDAVLATLLPGGGSRDVRAVRLMLGQVDPEAEAGPLDWPTPIEVANHLEHDRRAVAAAWQQHLGALDDTASLRRSTDLVAELLESLGGIASADEVAARVLDRRGSHSGDAARRAQALALVRVAAERPGALPVHVRRVGGTVLLAGGEGVDAGTADEMLEAARLLGEAAQQLSQGDALAAPRTVLDALRVRCEQTPLRELPDGRLRDLAAAAAGGVAVSARDELYPVGMGAARALALCAGMLVAGPTGLAVPTVRQRVRARFPAAQPLPERPALDALLREAGVDLRWQGDTYVPHTARAPSSLTSTSHHGGAQETELVKVDATLRRSLDERGFLALAVPQRHALGATRRLLQEQGVVPVDVSAWVLDELRTMASTHGADWQFLLRTDSRLLPDADRAELDRIISSVAGALPEHVAAQGSPVLLTGAGVLARHGCVDVLEPLASMTRPRSSAVWLLAPQPSAAANPMLDGAAVPLSSPTTQWLVLPSRWSVGIPTSQTA